ncbi:MAG TPA: rhomboid family intramembrane serine protease, partial [Pyrinomonadaceae bacterium]|nr:rhomboid family intramembrane serine protease [Pyrinomonadaceae bacterium]
LMSISGGADGATLVAYGAKVNSLVGAGEWWRFVTPVFLHVSVPGFGPMHLLVNMYSLFMLGPYVEKLYGSAKFVFFWIATGVAGVAASYFASSYEMHEGFLGRFLFRGGDGPSAGASGALFGLVGVLFVFGIKFRRELPEEFKRAFGVGMLPMILMNLFIGYAIPMIDNAAHLGGLLAGVVLALFVGYKRPGERAGVAFAWHAAQVACLVLVVVGFFMVWRNYSGPRPSPSAMTLPGSGDARGNEASVAAYVEAVNGGMRALGKMTEGDAGELEEAAEKLNRVPPLDADADALRAELAALVTRARDLAAAPPDEQAQLKNQLGADYAAWRQRFARWATTEGGDFGIRRAQPAPAPETAPEK